MEITIDMDKVEQIRKESEIIKEILLGEIEEETK